MYRLNEKEVEILHQVEDITGTDYDINNGEIAEENLLEAVRELMVEIANLNDKIVAIEDDREENYELKKYNPYADIGMSERDFY